MTSVTEDGRSVRYRINEPSVIHQTIDGELVIIHLDRGLYFSLDATGARIWNAIGSGLSVEAVGQELVDSVNADPADVSAAVDELVARLLAEELLVARDGDQPSDAQRADDAASLASRAVSTERSAFTPPVLQRYDDLQDLLLLDPIHAVDESGWPDRRDGS